jgi:hypothetical protein
MSKRRSVYPQPQELFLMAADAETKCLSCQQAMALSSSLLEEKCDMKGNFSERVMG